MDEQRALMDALMGKERNFTESDKQRYKKIHYSDRNVCKYYLLGCCPYTMFSGTKADLGICKSTICNNNEAVECKREFDLAISNGSDGDNDGGSGSKDDEYEYQCALYSLLEDLVR